MPEKTNSVWLNGALVPWGQAHVHVLSQGLHYGAGVFEGIRCYATAQGPALFRLDDHVRRFFHSARALGLPLPYDAAQLSAAIVDTVRDNGLSECYVRPLAFGGNGGFDLTVRHAPVHVAVAVWPWKDYLGPSALNGIRARTSSFVRPHPSATLTSAKITGNYVNSILAKQEAADTGFDEAILLSSEGCVLEASSENLFLIEKGVLYTPPRLGILAGITRDSVMALAQEMGVTVREESFMRDRLYGAEEVFLTGTAAEVVPVREIDGRTISNGARGQLTERLQAAYADAVRGRDSTWLKWLTPLNPLETPATVAGELRN